MAVDLADVFDASRAGLTVDFKSTVATANDGLCNRNPWIVVAEDTGIFLVSRRIRGNFTEVQVIFGVGRLQEHNAILCIKLFFDR